MKHDRPVISPHGAFPTAAAASRAAGVAQSTAHRWARERRHGWGYASDGEAPHARPARLCVYGTDSRGRVLRRWVSESGDA